MVHLPTFVEVVSLLGKQVPAHQSVRNRLQVDGWTNNSRTPVDVGFWTINCQLLEGKEDWSVWLPAGLFPSTIKCSLGCPPGSGAGVGRTV